MHLPINPQTIFYRVIDRALRWAQVLNGLGSFLGKKKTGRYHGVRQRTVYAASDPLVTLTEAAFYEALGVQERIGMTLLQHTQQLPPLTAASFRLWAFRLNQPPWVIDVEHNTAFVVFQHPPFVLRNPTSGFYQPTQDLMDAVFGHPAPPPPAQKAWGAKVPSVRTPRVLWPPLPPSQAYQPFHYAFLLQPNQNQLPATLVARWNLEVEFLDKFTQTSVTPHTTLVDWERPQITLVPVAGAGVVSALGNRPNGQDYQPGIPYRIDINYN